MKIIWKIRYHLLLILKKLNRELYKCCRLRALNLIPRIDQVVKSVELQF